MSYLRKYNFAKRSQRTRLLYLSPVLMQAYAWTGKHISLIQSFPDTQGGLDQFTEYLEHHQEPHTLLVDVVEEDFRLETIPHVHGSKHHELIERKLDWHYKNLPLRLALFRQRLKSGRRDDEILLSSLTNQQHLAPWLQRIQSAGTPLSGIYSPPYLGANLLSHVQHEQVLLLTWQENSGLRQSYFRHKQLCLSRLTPAEENADFARLSHDETQRLMRHLENAGMLKPDFPLNVYIVCHAEDFAKVSAMPDQSPNIRYFPIDLHQTEAKFCIPGQSLRPDSTRLYLSMLGKKQPQAQYAPETYTHHYWLWQQRRRLMRSSALCLFAGLAFSLAMLIKAHTFGQQIQSTRQEIGSYSIRIESLLSARPVTPVPIDEMKSTVTFFDSLDRLFPPPESHLRRLSFALDQHPQVLTQKINWTTDIHSTGLPLSPRHSIHFEGELIGFNNAYRDALSYLDQFKSALESNGLAIVKQGLPVDTTPDGNIHADQNNETAPLLFSLELESR